MHDGSQCWVCVKVPEHSVCKAVVDCPSSGFCCPLAATLNDAIGTTVFIHQPPCTLCSLLVRCVCVQLCCDNGCRSSNWAGAFDAGIEEPTGPKVLFAVKDFASLKREVCVTAVSLLRHLKGPRPNLPVPFDCRLPPQYWPPMAGHSP